MLLRRLSWPLSKSLGRKLHRREIGAMTWWIITNLVTNKIELVVGPLEIPYH